MPCRGRGTAPGRCGRSPPAPPPSRRRPSRTPSSMSSSEAASTPTPTDQSRAEPEDRKEEKLTPCLHAKFKISKLSHRMRILHASLLQNRSFVPVPNCLLSRFWNRDKASGTKASRLLSRVAEPGQNWDMASGTKTSRVAESGQNVSDAKIFLHPAGFDPKTSCLAHGFLTNSPK